MAEIIGIEAFLKLKDEYPLIDVRAPLEFEQGHIPGARNIPLFSDQERKEVGTAFKQINKEAAMYLGLDFVGKKLVDLARQGEKAAGRKKTLLVHCWRGGMRSSSMAWLYETLGLKCYLLEGGYKSYRHYAQSSFTIKLELLVVGGRTGSGKTDILKELQKEGEQVIDLEGLARHKGSAFGALGEEPQPTTEQFENDLHAVLACLDSGRLVWIEDESRNVGRCVIPGPFYEQMRQSRIIFLDIGRELRSKHLVKHYAGYQAEELKQCIFKISKRLGGDRTREALESIDRSDFQETAMITLAYYDKTYMFSLEKNHPTHEVLGSESIDPVYNASLLVKRYYEDKG